MKIVAVNGSPTGEKGSTGRSLAAVAAGAREAGADVTLFELGRLQIAPCTSCHVCQKTGECPIEDDYPTVKDALLAADALVLASPNYIYNISAQLKALLDRSFSFIFHCQALHKKYGAAVLASGGPQYQRVEEYLLHVLGTMGCWTVGSFVAGGGRLDDPDEGPRALEEARELGRTLAAAVKDKQRFPDQEEGRMLTFEMMRWLTEQNKSEWPYEYEFWQNHWADE